MPEHIYIVLSDPKLGSQVEKAVLRPAGYKTTLVCDPLVVEMLVKANHPDLIIIGEKLNDADGLTLGTSLLEDLPQLPIILLAEKPSETILKEAIQAGFADCIIPPVQTNEVLEAVKRALLRRNHLQEWVQSECRQSTERLRQRLDGLEALQQVGRSVTSSLDLDSVLTAVVDAAVEMTRAEEGSLLLLDDSSGELYMRAARNFQDEFVRTFRLPIRDTLAGQVLRSGKPLTLDRDTPEKIKTSYLVHTLIYVPLQVHGRVIGVLGVDNRQSKQPFSEYHTSLVSALADYAAIAIENAQLYSSSEIERYKLETILTNIEDGVIVIGYDRRLILVNQTVRHAFNLKEDSLNGKPVQDIFDNPDLLDIFEDGRVHPSRNEINLTDGRVFNAMVTPIPEVGLAVTMQDITHLKELDRIKSDFVHTVSHDLRSPLTAILGYVELIERTGPTTDQQREFISRVQFSVNNITSLINDLLDLGRIEAGFDSRKEVVHIPAIIRYSVEGLWNRINEKKLDVEVNLPKELPPVLGSPVRLRQLISNLIGNAIKYTNSNGRIEIRARSEGSQIILQVEDSGMGIPPADQPYIFDKFYRGSNVPHEIPGTGLGLAIVKSIVENHQGRIWVDSAPGKGSTFTIVLPITDQEL